MEKILDYLNNRDFAINTIDGAKKIAAYFLADKPEVLTRTEEAGLVVQALLKSYKPVFVSKEEIIMATYLHAIAESGKLRLSGFNPHDAFNYLKYNGWSPNVCNLVLLQCMSRELALTKSPELYYIYMEAESKVPLSDQLIYSLGLVGRISTVPKYVEIDTYRNSLSTTYSKDSNEYKTGMLLTRILYENENTFSLIKKIGRVAHSNLFT